MDGVDLLGSEVNLVLLPNGIALVVELLLAGLGVDDGGGGVGTLSVDVALGLVFHGLFGGVVNHIGVAVALVGPNLHLQFAAHLRGELVVESYEGHHLAAGHVVLILGPVLAGRSRTIGAFFVQFLAEHLHIGVAGTHHKIELGTLAVVDVELVVAVLPLDGVPRANGCNLIGVVLLADHCTGSKVLPQVQGRVFRVFLVGDGGATHCLEGHVGGVDGDNRLAVGHVGGIVVGINHGGELGCQLDVVTIQDDSLVAFGLCIHSHGDESCCDKSKDFLHAVMDLD